jgi:hypothetical protein
MTPIRIRSRNKQVMIGGMRCLNAIKAAVDIAIAICLRPLNTIILQK